MKEFYANLYSSEDRPPKQSRVRGHLVKIDANSLNTFLETLVVLSEGETLPAYSKYCRLPTDYRHKDCLMHTCLRVHLELLGPSWEDSQEGSDYTSSGVECPLILQLGPHITYL